MGQEMGLSRWLDMSLEDQRVYLRQAEQKKAVELATLSYEESLRQFLGLLRLMKHFPIPERRDHPIGLAKVIE